MAVATAGSRFLDLPALAGLERMRFYTRQRIDGTFSGRHVSRQLGGGGEFADYREYSPGEDLRRLDWKVYARTGKPYVRLHQDETNLPCTLAIDVSGSMQFGAKSNTDGTSSKLEYAQYLATALSHVIALGQDQAGLAVLSERLNEFLPPGGAPSHISRVQQQIEALKTEPVIRMAASLQELFERSRARGVLLIISDFLFEDLQEVFAALRLFRSRQFEVILLHLVHPGEERLPEQSACRFEDLEGGGVLDCSPAEIQEEYTRKFAEHLATVRAYALAGACDYRLVSLTQSYLQVLHGFLMERSG